MLRCGCPGTIQFRLTSTEPGSFFYPVQFHLQTANFFVEFRLDSFVFLVTLRMNRRKQVFGAHLHLAFPLADLGRMNLIQAR